MESVVYANGLCLQFGISEPKWYLESNKHFMKATVKTVLLIYSFFDRLHIIWYDFGVIIYLVRAQSSFQFWNPRASSAGRILC